MTKAIWRDVSKTSKAGLTFPEYRLKMPNGEAVLKLDKGAVFDEADHSQYIFCVRCFSANIVNESTGERDPDKAKKAAATKGSDSAAEPKPERKRGLTAAEKAVKTTSGKAEKKREDDTKGGTKKLTRKPRGRVAGKTDS